MQDCIILSGNGTPPIHLWHGCKFLLLICKYKEYPQKFQKFGLTLWKQTASLSQMKKHTILAIALASVPLALSASTPLWMRDIKISPDGNTIAFTYKGDIWTVPAAGGKATRITTADSYETSPVWSPDGKKIAFASDRHGSLDIFIWDVNGGNTRVSHRIQPPKFLRHLLPTARISFFPQLFRRRLPLPFFPHRV